MSIFCLSQTGCATYNTATGRREFILISTDSEVMLGQQFHQSIIRESHLCGDPAKNERLNRIGQRLAQVSDRQDYEYHFYLLASKELNAFTIPGGTVYVYEGLYDRLKSDDQIASVLAHEIGHCAAKHTVKKFQAALGYNVVSSIVLAAIGNSGARDLASLGGGEIMGLAMSAYGREDEYEADRLGIKYMHLAGYDLNAMIQTFEILEQETKDRKGPPLILRSHPYLEDRITAVRKEIATVNDKY